MPSEDKVEERMLSRLRDTRMGKLFLHKKFAHYTWIGIFISILNIFLLWLLIDNFHIPTVISSTLVIAGTFVLRYVLFDSFKIL
ncbi:MAG: GtrA family protein [Patescibacteria group bacterium]|nr:GtrA family protein [Patescibacteria group bacterium]